MIYLIAGATHTGKTLLAQRMLEKHHIPYLSLDHLKMGLIRSGNTELTVFDDEKMTDYLWPIAREMIKTAIENGQSLIVEGCYIPFTWASDFEEGYRRNIRCEWLIMSENYIRHHFGDIRSHAGEIENRLDDSELNMEDLIRENAYNLRMCQRYNCGYALIDESYKVELF